MTYTIALTGSKLKPSTIRYDHRDDAFWAIMEAKDNRQVDRIECKGWEGTGHPRVTVLTWDQECQWWVSTGETF